MAYEMVMPYHLHMPSYFLETFTEYPFLFPLFFIATAIYNFHKTSITQVSAPTISSKHIFHLFSFKFFIRGQCFEPQAITMNHSYSNPS